LKKLVLTYRHKMPRFAGAAAATTAIQHHRMTPDMDPEANLKKAMDKEMSLRQKQADKEAKRRLPYQNDIKQFYDKKSIQIFVAVLILLNFLISAVQSQLLPKEGRDDIAIFIFEAFEWFFAYAFLVELIVNFYGSYFCEFWASAWNVFDFVIVAISLLSLYMSNLPGISVLRLFRAFRVVRLFKRIKTMRKMMDSIMKSLPGMAIAFSALFLIMGIYAIIGVNFWMETFPDEFGTFLKAVLSLLQIMTFDSWCSGIARKIIFAGGVIEAIYFISYVFIASIIMANVLIALLLDEFMNTSQEVDNEPEEDVGHELDKKLEEEHEEAAKEILSDPKHMGLNMMSMMQTIDYRKDTRIDPVSDCADESLDKDRLLGEKVSHCDIEMQDTSYSGMNRKPAKKITQIKGGVRVHYRGEVISLEEQVETAQICSVNTNGKSDHNNGDDSAWRTRIEKDIKTLSRSVETFHTKFEQMDGKLDQLDIRLSGFFAHTLELQREKSVGGTK